MLKADMGIKSRRDIRAYMEEISTGKSSLLKNVTSGYHYHTIDAESEEILDAIQEELQQKGFLAKLQDYEPWISGAVRNKKRKNLRTRLSTSLILVLVIPKEFQSTLLYLEYLKI